MANLKHFNPVTGQWEEIKVSTKFTELLHTEKLTQDQNYVNIGITNFNPNEDVIFSICNSTWLQKDEDYTVNGGLLRIESKDGSNWKNGSTFNFVCLKNVDKDALPTTDASLLQDGSITIAKLATSIQNYIIKIGTAALTTTAITLSDAINELDAKITNQNEIINGNFDFWQRGVSAVNPSTTGYYTADRFKLYGFISAPPSNIIHSKLDLNIDDIPKTSNAYRILVNGSGIFNATDIYMLQNMIENGTIKLCGDNKKITISFWARSNIANKKIGIYGVQNYGTGGSPSLNEVIPGANFSLTSNWKKFSITLNTNTLTGKSLGTNKDDCFRLNIVYAYGSTYAINVGDTIAETFGGAGTIDIAQVKLEAGDKATPFVPRPIGEELALCYRYYQRGAVTAQGSSGVNFGGYVINGNTYQTNVKFKNSMRTTPTVILTNVYNSYFVSTPTLLETSMEGFIEERQANATGQGRYISSFTAESEIY